MLRQNIFYFEIRSFFFCVHAFIYSFPTVCWLFLFFCPAVRRSCPLVSFDISFLFTLFMQLQLRLTCRYTYGAAIVTNARMIYIKKKTWKVCWKCEVKFAGTSLTCTTDGKRSAGSCTSTVWQSPSPTRTSLPSGRSRATRTSAVSGKSSLLLVFCGYWYCSIWTQIGMEALFPIWVAVLIHQWTLKFTKVSIGLFIWLKHVNSWVLICKFLDYSAFYFLLYRFFEV